MEYHTVIKRNELDLYIIMDGSQNMWNDESERKQKH